MHESVIMSGFGGQGILLMGQLLCYAGNARGQKSHLDALLRTGDARGNGQLHGDDFLRPGRVSGDPLSLNPWWP